MDLQGLFARLDAPRNADLLVGIETMDDAAVYRLDDETALVVTADYITPVIDDPLWFGRVAAANAISDVYAMGGRPITALNLCNFPATGVEMDDLGKILQGGAEKIREAGAVLAGGHTVRDDELKYGLSVNGIVHPSRFTSNSAAQAGDRFILTKPIGTGVHITAAKKGLIGPEKIMPVVEAMATLNKVACEAMVEFECRSATDITGFGLGGHTLSMARASGVGIRFFLGAVPRFPDTLALISDGVRTGVTASNGTMIENGIRFAEGIDGTEATLFSDPQTSGGLFIAVRGADADALLKRLHEKGVTEAAIVGEAFRADVPYLEVVRS